MADDSGAVAPEPGSAAAVARRLREHSGLLVGLTAPGFSVRRPETGPWHLPRAGVEIALHAGCSQRGAQWAGWNRLRLLTGAGQRVDG